MFLNITFLCYTRSAAVEWAKEVQLISGTQNLLLLPMQPTNWHTFSEEDIIFSRFHCPFQRIDHTCMYKHNGCYNQGITNVTLEPVYVCGLVGDSVYFWLFSEELYNSWYYLLPVRIG